MELKDIYGDRISKNLDNPITINRLKMGIGSFIDKYSYILYTFDFCSRWSFSENDKGVVYDAISITEPELERAIRASKDIPNASKIKSNPFYVACMLLVRGLLKRGDEQMSLLVMVYASMPMYLSAHYGRWHIIPNRNIMDYTIAHLDKGFGITKMRSLYEFIFDNAKTTFDTYRKWLYSDEVITAVRVEKKHSTKKTEQIVNPGSDAEIARIIDQLFIRIKQKLTNIASEFYDNQKSGRYLNYDSESYDPENYREVDNDSYAMDRLASKVYNKLINHQFKAQWLKMSITQTSVSLPKLTALFDDIIENDDDESLRKLILATIEYFCMVGGNPVDKVSTGTFVTTLLSGYTSASGAQQMTTIKSILDRWLEENSTRYGKARYGKTAAVAYKKSIFTTILYIINYEAKLS